MSNILFEAKELAFSYPGSTGQVFSGASFVIHTGAKTALLGDNGSGKSTLLRLIAKELEPDTGTICIRKCSTFLLKQEDAASGGISAMSWLMSAMPSPGINYKHMETLERTGKSEEAALANGEFTAAGGWELCARVSMEASVLGFNSAVLERTVESFSGGERKMLALMAGFLRKPDLYLLDEPTNYLDDTAMARLAGAVKAFKGACVIVSHDRAFLDLCVDKVFELERNSFSVYTGNYSSYAAQKTSEFTRAGKEKERIEREISGLKEMERNYREWGAAKEKEKKGAADKGFIGARAARLQKKSARAAKRAREKIQDLERTKPFVEKTRHAFLPSSIETFLEVTGLSIKMGTRTLFNDLSFYLKSGDRLCIEGGNGVGKTTLLRILTGETLPDAGRVNHNRSARVLYMPQFWQAGVASKGSDYFPGTWLQAGCTMLDHLGAKGELMFSSLDRLSEGQRRKVDLVRFLVYGADIALLDEPTTHQDMHSIKILEEALLTFQGILVFISHDAEFKKTMNAKSIRLGAL